MGFGIVFIDKMDVVGGDDFHIILTSQGYEFRLDLALFFIRIMGGIDHCGLMSLQFDVIIIAHQVFPPCHGSISFFVSSLHKQLRNLAAQAGRGYNQTFVMFLDFVLVRTRVHIEAFGPCLRYQLYEIVVAGGVLGQNYEVTAYVALVHMCVKVFLRHVHLATEYGLKRMLLGILHCGFGFSHGFFIAAFACRLERSLGLVKHLAILLIDIIKKLLNAVHIAVVGEGNTGHTVVHSLIDKRRNRRLPVKQRILAVYM